MSSMSADESIDCPLCMEPLEVDDINFYPCTCGYQICRFCWHRIRTDENELCPACRKAYPENPADFTPLSQEQISALKSEKRHRDQQRKQKITENRKHLANVRVVQKNLVFVVGLPPRLSDTEILKKHEYFGKYGKIHKVVINPSTTYAGVQQGPSTSAYVTYCINSDALRAIQSVNNIMIDGRLVKTSLGTTKYCSHFMKNQSCPKPDCMYLHELGDPEASFTKEEMHQGKHQEYEKRLHDALIAQTSSGGISTNGDTGEPTEDGSGGTNDAWPSLSISPVNSKESVKVNGRHKDLTTYTKKNKERSRNKKSSKDKSLAVGNHLNSVSSTRSKTPSVSVYSASNTIKVTSKSARDSTAFSNRNSLPSIPAVQLPSEEIYVKSEIVESTENISSACKPSSSEVIELEHTVPSITSMRVDEELKMLSELEAQQADDEDDDEDDEDDEDEDVEDDDDTEDKLETTSDSTESRSLSESVSGKSTPVAVGTFQEPSSLVDDVVDDQVVDTEILVNSKLQKRSSESDIEFGFVDELENSATDVAAPMESISPPNIDRDILVTKSPSIYSSPKSLHDGLLDNVIENTADRFNKLDMFDDNSSFFSNPNNFPQSFFKNEHMLVPPVVTSTHSPQLPDLLNGTELNKDRNNHAQYGDMDKLNLLKELGNFSAQTGYGDNWEAFKHALNKNKANQLDTDDILGLQLQNLQNKRNLSNTNPGLNHIQHMAGDYSGDYFNTPVDRYNSISHHQDSRQLPLRSAMQQPPSVSNADYAHVYSGNMSKFFDFHKNQQQQQQQQQLLQNNLASLSINQDMLNMPSQYQDSLGQKHRLQQQQLHQGMHNYPSSQQQLQHSRLQSLYTQHNSIPTGNNVTNSGGSVDDDLGFDPFFETQKGLAELLENELVQQKKNSVNPRARMPPPGFNHMSTYTSANASARQPQHSSKILPFMNGSSNIQPHQSHHLNLTNNHNWNAQQQTPFDSNNSHQPHKSGSGLADWTSLDPAIVSFRQYPSYMTNQQPQIHQQQQQQQQQSQNQQHMHMHNQQQLFNVAMDMFLPQHGQSPQSNVYDSNKMMHIGNENSLNFSVAGRSSMNGLGSHGSSLNNIQNNILNQQHQHLQQQQINNLAQVNYSRSNWMSSEQNQNMFMNNLTQNRYEKFSIPMPPGFQNNSSGVKN